MKRATVAVAAATLVLTAACSTSPVDTTPTVPLDGIGNQPGSTLIAPNGATGEQTEQPVNETSNPDQTETPETEQVTEPAEGAEIESQDPGSVPDEDIVADIEDLLDSLDDLDDLLGGLDDDLGDLDESFEEDEGDIEG